MYSTLDLRHRHITYFGWGIFLVEAKYLALGNSLESSERMKTWTPLLLIADTQLRQREQKYYFPHVRVDQRFLVQRYTYALILSDLSLHGCESSRRSFLQRDFSFLFPISGCWVSPKLAFTLAWAHATCNGLSKTILRHVALTAFS